MHSTLPPQTPCRTDVVHGGHAATASATAAVTATESGAAPGTGAGAGSAGAHVAGTGTTPSPSTSPEDQPGWKTKSKWLHWDMSPFHWVDGTMPPYEWSPYTRVSENNATASATNGNAKVQGLLNLIDAREQDGGFLCVPGFHKHLQEWVAAQPVVGHGLKDDQGAQGAQAQSRPAAAYDFCEVPSADPMIGHAQRVPMRKGALLVWNSELPHCNYSNDSNRFRMVQYIQCFPAPAVGFVGLHERRRCHTKEVLQALGNQGVGALDRQQKAMLGLEGP